MTTTYEIVGGDYGPTRISFSTLAEAESSLLHLEAEFPATAWSIVAIDSGERETTMTEWCLVNDEGVVEDGFFTFADAQAALAASDPDDELEIDERINFDEDGVSLEEDEFDA